MSSANIATKTSGHAKVFPPSPLPRGTPPTPPFQKLRNAIEPLSGGIRGQTFCSTLQLSHRFKMLKSSYIGSFFGNYFWCVTNDCLNRAAQRGLHSIGKAALLSRRSHSPTRTSRVHSLLVAQTEQLEAELAPPLVTIYNPMSTSITTYTFDKSSFF